MRHSRRSTLFAAAMMLSAVACGGPSQHSKAAITQGSGSMQSGDRAAGERIFATNCSACHGATGVEGGRIGPSLRHESERMDYGAIVSWIEDPEPPMPHLYPRVLTEEEVRDVAAYVNSL